MLLCIVLRQPSLLLPLLLHQVLHLLLTIDCDASYTFMRPPCCQVDAALSSLALLPPGAEAAALAALDFGLSEQNVAPLLAAAHADLQTMQASIAAVKSLDDADLMCLSGTESCNLRSESRCQLLVPSSADQRQLGGMGGCRR